MKLTPTAQKLHDVILTFEIIDAHEHLPTEKDYLAFDYCGPNFFAGYIWNDLLSAGMPPEIKSSLRDPGYRPVEAWWPQISPWWNAVKYGSYARAARITARDLYGISDINDKTVHDLAERIRADNVPGLYHRILRERCNIRVALTNQTHTKFQDDPLLRPVMLIEDWKGWTWHEILSFGKKEGVEVSSLEDLTESCARRLARLKAEGAVGFKTHSISRIEPTEQEAEAVFQRIRRCEHSEDPVPLADYLFWKALERAAEIDMPVAVHAGLWNDFRTLNPTWMIRWAIRCPQTRFDLFHLGIPYAREAAMIAKNLPNVTLDFCWCYIISERMTRRMIDEVIDLVPLNKIVAFGADYRVVVQKVYGHLVMARETIAAVLGHRVDDGTMGTDEAIQIARAWFFDNPMRIYRLQG